MENSPNQRHSFFETAKALGAVVFLEFVSVFACWGTLNSVESGGPNGTLGTLIGAAGTLVLAATAGLSWQQFHQERDGRIQSQD